MSKQYNSKQTQNCDECWCECKEQDGQGSCEKCYMWNPSTCDCECNKACKIVKLTNSQLIKIVKHYFYGDMISIQNLDPQKMKMDKNSYKNNLIYYVEYVTVKDLRNVKIYSVNFLYLIINRTNEPYEDINKNKYLTLVPTDKSKEIIKKSMKKNMDRNKISY